MHHLERESALEMGIEGQVNDPHSARTQDSQQVISTKAVWVGSLLEFDRDARHETTRAQPVLDAPYQNCEASRGGRLSTI